MMAIFSTLTFLLSGAWAGEPTTVTPPQNLLPRTMIVTMIVPGIKDDPAQTPEVMRACAFAAQHTANLGYTVANYCDGPSPTANTLLPRPGDPVVFLVFASSPVDPNTLSRVLPPQAAVGTNGTSVVGVLSVPFAGNQSDTLVSAGGPFSATVVFPGEDPGRVARIFIRCAFEGGQTGLSFEEANTCWGRVSAEDLAGQYLHLEGGWDPIFNGSKLLYPPRTSPTDKITSQTARELRRYDEQHRKFPTEPPLPPRPFFEGWGADKVVLTSMGGVAVVASGIGILSVYGKGVSLAEEINRGEHGTVGSPELSEATAEYERLGGTLPWLYGSTAVGLAAVGIGFALPVESKDNTVKAMVHMTPTGVEFIGTF